MSNYNKQLLLESPYKELLDPVLSETLFYTKDLYTFDSSSPRITFNNAIPSTLASFAYFHHSAFPGTITCSDSDDKSFSIQISKKHTLIASDDNLFHDDTQKKHSTYYYKNKVLIRCPILERYNSEFFFYSTFFYRKEPQYFINNISLLIDYRIVQVQ